MSTQVPRPDTGDTWSRGRVIVSPSSTELARLAAEEWVECARKAIEERGSFAVALSGGATPQELYTFMATPAFASRVDWGRTRIFWGDERAVPPDDPRSNYRMAKDALLDHVPVPVSNVHRMPADRPDLEAAAAEYDSMLRGALAEDHDGRRGLDLVLLGLGGDGHIASLFPGAPALQEQHRWVMATYSISLDQHRMTVTYPAINSARCIFFLVTGASKAAVLAAVLEGPYDPERLPAQGVRPGNGKLLWLVDEAAAGTLSDSIRVTGG
jgi:6-phosphogluconolactonase